MTVLLWAMAACTPLTPVDLTHEAPTRDKPPVTEAWSHPDFDPTAPTGMSRLVRDEIIHATQQLTGLAVADLVSFPEETQELGFDHLDGSSPMTSDLVDAMDRFTTGTADAWEATLRGSYLDTSWVADWGGGGCPIEDTVGTDSRWWMPSRGFGPEHTVHLPIDGDWMLSLAAFYQPGSYSRGGSLMRILWDGEEIWNGRVNNQVLPKRIDVPLFATGGPHVVKVDVIEGGGYGGNCQYVDGAVVGDFTVTGPRPADAPRCATGDDACIERWVERMAWRAWRHRPSEAAVERLLIEVDELLEQGVTLDHAMSQILRAVLMSPNFIFLPEDEGALADWQIAARLARVLWSSIPDETLLQCAEDGLTGDCSITAQTDRMLADPKADAFIRRFLDAWLGLRGLESSHRDPEQFPHFAAASPDLAGESAAVFAEMLNTDRPATDLLTAPFTWLTPALAQHYGLPSQGEGWHRYEQPGGLLSHASVLTATSPADRTSPVLRGAWMLRRMLCEQPEPPPPDIPALEEGGDAAATLAEHRDNPACASCHDTIDPMGVPLEAFDQAGRARSGPTPSIETIDGALLQGPADLASWLATNPRHERCLVRNMASWALASPVDMTDIRLDEWLAHADAEGASWRAILDAVLNSSSFSRRVLP